MKSLDTTWMGRLKLAYLNAKEAGSSQAVVVDQSRDALVFDLGEADHKIEKQKDRKWQVMEMIAGG